MVTITSCKAIKQHVATDGSKATTWECPTGRYRWLVLAGRALSDLLRVKRPRYGWREWFGNTDKS